MNTSSTPETRPFRRRLSALERLRFRLPNPNVVMMAQLEGDVSVGRLTAAIRKVRQRHPLLRAAIRLDKDDIAWFTSKNVSAIPLHVVTEHERSWVNVVLEETRYRFDTATGPLIRITAVLSEWGVELVINAHHAICDGLSLVHLVDDLTTLLAEPERDLEHLPVPPAVDYDVAPVSETSGPLQRFIMRLIQRKWRKAGISFDHADFKQLHQTFWRQHENGVAMCSLTELQTSHLVSRCRQEQVTVTSAILAAFLQAESQVRGSEPDYQRNVIVTVDLRKRLCVDVKETFGLYASAVRTELDVEAQTNFWDAARNVHERLHAMLTDEEVFAALGAAQLPPTLMDALSFTKYGMCDHKLATRFLQRSGNDDIHVGLLLTNLGRLDMPTDFAGLQIKTLYGPFVYSDTHEKYLGTLTINGRLHMALSYGKNVVAPQVVQQLSQRAVALLVGASS